MTAILPIRREVVVPAEQGPAFEIFTGRIGVWWPLGEHGVHGTGGTVGFEDGQLIERGPDGEQSVWGTVTEWDAPRVVAFTWHPGASPEQATLVTVTFQPAGDETLVILEHSGWEAVAEGIADRAGYEEGWPPVIDRYVALVAHATDPSAGTWVALLHRPGVNAPTEHPVFSDPRFGDHVAFLSSMLERGYLIAAGPLGDEAGAGLTILRLPGDDQLEEATRLATEIDASVAGGFFDVTVRPWFVQLAAG